MNWKTRLIVAIAVGTTALGFGCKNYKSRGSAQAEGQPTTGSEQQPGTGGSGVGSEDQQPSTGMEQQPGTGGTGMEDQGVGGSGKMKKKDGGMGGMAADGGTGGSGESDQQFQDSSGVHDSTNTLDQREGTSSPDGIRQQPSDQQPQQK